MFTSGYKNNKYFSIAIDGPCGSGKSTVARMVAKRLNFLYIDTGAMYRAVAYYFLLNCIDISDKQNVILHLSSINININFINNTQRILLDDVDVTEKLRIQQIADLASVIALIPEVRVKLVKIQKDIALKYDVVMDGRDIGTHVLPMADLKVYLDADLEVRAKRRCAELNEKGISGSYETVKREIADRDYRDMHRENSPLAIAANAVVLDTTNMSINDVEENIVKLYNERVEIF